MFGIDGLETPHLIQMAYVLIGLLVTYWHVKRHHMGESMKGASVGPAHAGSAAFCLLALIWPVLVFAWLFEPKPPRNPADKAD